MEDQKPSGEEADMAMVVYDQKPITAVMVIDDQKQSEAAAAAAAAAARFPVGEVTEAVALVEDLKARLDAFPDARDGLLDLLVGFGEGRGGDARAGASRAVGLLAVHPDALDTFTAYVSGAATKLPAAEPPLALTRPRRNSTRKSRPLPLPPPPKEEEEQEPPPRKGGDPRVLEALEFLERVRDIAGREVWEKFVEALDAAGSDRGMDAGEVYGGVMAALGPAHAGLLAEFAVRFLPGKQEWVAEERRQARNRRRAEARAVAAAAAAAVVDQKPHGIRATLDIVKKRPAADGDHRAHDGGGDTRTKKPRAAAAAATGTNVRVNNGDKKPRRRGAPSAAATAAPAELSESEKREALIRRFRELWVFYTGYSTLVATMARAEDLLLAAASDAGEFPATVEEIFPRRESREFLASYYGGRWGAMVAAMEGGRAGAALKAVVESLRRKEAEAVAEEAAERRRQDAARAAERLAGLVKDRVRREERRRLRRKEKDAGGGGGGASASGQQQACVPAGDVGRRREY